MTVQNERTPNRFEKLLGKLGMWSTGNAALNGPKPEIKQLDAALEQLVKRSGMWSTGHGGSSGPNPELDEPELIKNEDSSNSQV